MLGDEYIVVAVILRLAAGLGYLVATWRRIVQPNPVSWLLWGLTPMIAFLAQIQDGVTPQAWVILTLGTSPLLVFTVSVARRTRWRVSQFDGLCGGSAVAGVVLWQITSDPVLALVFSIVADILASVPTLAKGYEAPGSERSLPYFASMVSMVVILLTISDWKFMEYAFPLYMLFINTAIFSVVRLRSAQLGTRPLDNVVTPAPQRPVAAAGRPALARAHPPTVVVARIPVTARPTWRATGAADGQPAAGSVNKDMTSMPTSNLLSAVHRPHKATDGSPLGVAPTAARHAPASARTRRAGLLHP